MKKIIKILVLPILHFIKRILTILKVHALPEAPKPRTSPFHYKKTSYHYYQDEEIEKCYQHFKKHFKTSVFFEDRTIRDYAITQAIKNDKNLEKTYLEFGVFVGKSINFFSKFVNKIYGFDSFEGLREDWHGHWGPTGTFDLKKKIPKLNKNVVPVVGWIQDTLTPFLEKNKPEINFIHLDLDTYESTKYVLEKIKPYLIKNSVIIFDQLYNYPGWTVGEYKALTEVFTENEYKFIAFHATQKGAVIKILV